MSKIGRKPIDIKNLQVQIEGNKVVYKGKKASGTYEVPAELAIEKVGDSAIRLVARKKTPDINRIWGLHRALLANALQGADKGFEEQLQINGLGFKASVSGKKVV